MAVHLIKTPIATSMGTISDMGSLPIRKTDIPAEGLDARMLGNNLAQECIALTMTQANSWHSIAWRLMRTTTDTRAAFIKALDKQLANMRESVADMHGMDDKGAKKTVASATTQISNCRTVANAFNAGATIEGFRDWLGVDDPENAGFIKIVEYARTFSKSKAGRTPDTMLVKLNKWLDAQKRNLSGESTVEDQRVIAELTEVYNRLVNGE